MRYEIVDESDVPRHKAGVGRWTELYAVLDTLPPGKWIRIPVEDGQMASTLATNLLSSARHGRKPYKLKTRSNNKKQEIFVTIVERYEIKRSE